MPQFEIDGKKYENPVQLALDKIGGKWKMPILWRLNKKIYRTGELRRDIPNINQKMLTQQLRELEDDGFVHRKVYPVVPPKVEYSITEKGRDAIPVIEMLRDWGIKLIREEGFDNYEKH
jgi:DNA-binding HxlR family transcriptional regulator